MSSPALALRSRMPRVAGSALERARLTVVPRARRRASSPVPFLILVSMVAVAGVVGLLLFNTSMQQASFAATSLQNQADSLTAQQQALEMQLDGLRNPQRIALRAQRMGMVLPTSPAVIRLSDGKVLGSPAVATRVDPLRLLAPPPVKPAALDPQPHVTYVTAQTNGHGHGHGHAASHHAGANSHHNTGSGSPGSGSHAGRKGH